jgi:diguanylate cyclase (GGDEF)-like protein
VVPLVPWGLREALIATGIVYLIFTASTLSAVKAFNSETLWTLQFLMLTSAMIALTVVIRAVLIRKEHVQARFKLTLVNKELYGLSHRDALTGAWNRRFLEEQFSSIVERYSAERQAACFCLTDIDNFKKLNDTHGHPCGDRVLQLLVIELNAALTSDEYVVRMGGDEFAILLRGDLAQDRIRQAQHKFNRHNEACPELKTLPRFSAGLIILPFGIPTTFEDCYLKADQALYVAKEHSLYENLVIDSQIRGVE